MKQIVLKDRQFGSVFLRAGTVFWRSKRQPELGWTDDLVIELHDCIEGRDFRPLTIQDDHFKSLLDQRILKLKAKHPTASEKQIKSWAWYALQKHAHQPWGAEAKVFPNLSVGAVEKNKRKQMDEAVEELKQKWGVK